MHEQTSTKYCDTCTSSNKSSRKKYRRSIRKKFKRTQYGGKIYEPNKLTSIKIDERSRENILIIPFIANLISEIDGLIPISCLIIQNYRDTGLRDNNKYHDFEQLFLNLYEFLKKAPTKFAITIPSGLRIRNLI